jgi:predicted nucleotidyltransferase
VQILHYYNIGGAIMGKLKELRIEKKMTQQEVAKLVGISLRSYKSYENDIDKQDTIKYEYIIDKLTQINFVDEEHGILTIEEIKRKSSKVLEQYDIKFCYLFGSYAKGKATPTSDVDFLISGNVRGLKFYGLVEELRTVLKKKVDVLDINQLKENLELTEEIFKDGIKIYG